MSGRNSVKDLALMFNSNIKANEEEDKKKKMSDTTRRLTKQD